VFLSIQTKDHAVGKRYRPVAELDAMLIRVVSGSTSDSFSHAGVPSGRDPSHDRLARLPSIDR
jgi:hypothetical protein